MIGLTVNMEYVYLASFFILTYGFVGYMLWTWNKESPCVGICKLDENDVCTGCGRPIEEIINKGFNHLADSIEIGEQRKRTLQNGLLAFLKKDPTHPLYRKSD